MTDALPFVLSGGITKNILSKSAPSGCAAMRSTPSFPDMEARERAVET